MLVSFGKLLAPRAPLRCGGHTRAAALCPALWFLDSHSRPSAPSTSHGPATNPSLLTSNLCKLALVHMIMYCRVGSSPRRSCSASSKSPEGLLLCPKAAIGQSNRQVSQHDCAGSSSGCCLPYLSLLSLVRQTFVFVHSRILRFCGYVLVATAFSRRRFLKSWLEQRGRASH